MTDHPYKLIESIGYVTLIVNGEVTKHSTREQAHDYIKSIGLTTFDFEYISDLYRSSHASTA